MSVTFNIGNVDSEIHSLSLYMSSRLGTASSMEQILLVHFLISLLQQILPVIYFSLDFLFLFPLAGQISPLCFGWVFFATSAVFLVRKPSTPETCLCFPSLRIFHAIFCTNLLLLSYGSLAFLLAQTAVLITAPSPELCRYYVSLFSAISLFKTFKPF